ncbi:flagellar basal body-associated FliL family protein [Luteimonas sp. MHLX1A]|uniref:flagellar basal body-associated FliL family protein n=1 Tax=Alterluteimonas muca TaxID=2878684 RepID=UPI001E64CDC6|nr:flagellar basal body-associated FliL family protein [Luteimonas sp. MHLX1A]
MAVAADPSRKKPSSSSHRITLAIVAVVALLGLAGAGFWYFNTRGDSDAPKPPAPAQYLPMSPPFVVNLDETPMGPRYLQVEVQLVTRDPLATQELTRHEPALRARLLMLFAQQTYDGVATREGKEALRAQALEEVQALMTEETGAPQAESLLFTSFVTQ